MKIRYGDMKRKRENIFTSSENQVSKQDTFERVAIYLPRVMFSRSKYLYNRYQFQIKAKKFSSFVYINADASDKCVGYLNIK